MERLTRLLGVLVAVLLVASGVLMYLAAWERWWPACPRGGFDSARCVELQDHLYDFQFPADSWVPVGDAAWLAGLSFLLLAVALAGVPTVMLGLRRPVLTWVSIVVLSGSAVVLGLHALLSARSGEPELDTWLVPAGVGWALATPVMLITLAGVASYDERAGGGWGWLAVLFLIGSTPFGLYTGSGPIVTGYSSYDTSPWTEAVGGALLVLAGPALWRAGVLGARSQPVDSAADGADHPVSASDTI